MKIRKIDLFVGLFEAIKRLLGTRQTTHQPSGIEPPCSANTDTGSHCTTETGRRTLILGRNMTEKKTRSLTRMEVQWQNDYKLYIMMSFSDSAHRNMSNIKSKR